MGSSRSKRTAATVRLDLTASEAQAVSQFLTDCEEQGLVPAGLSMPAFVKRVLLGTVAKAYAAETSDASAQD